MHCPSLVTAGVLPFCSLVSIVFAVAPQAIPFSSNSYGPDGPWQAITIGVGTPSQSLDLLPGGSWSSDVLAPSVCVDAAVCTIAKLAGFYNASASSTNVQIGQTGNIRNSSFESTVGGLPSLTGSADWMFETAALKIRDGVAGQTTDVNLSDFDMLVISEASETLPDGTTYPVQIGSLSLGAPQFNQSWTRSPPNPRFNGTFLPADLFAQGRVPSNSYGLHIGSTSMRIPGSLNIGGFDQSRALGQVSSQAYLANHLPIDLLDIGIGVAEGGSPFNFTSKAGLLAAGNSTLSPSTSVFIEAPLPYIYLPQSTCDAITQYLPVSYQAKYGLYFWDTGAAEYQRIVSSPSFLSFTFRLNSNINQNFTINVPFALLNLTLTRPIVDRSTQYLPLRPTEGPSGKYVLGRAFLQAAFIGVNWQSASNDGSGAWFLAQAPGPNTQTHNDATTIQPSDATIVGSANSWTDTWKGAWTVLSETGNTSTGDTATTTSGSSTGPPTPKPPPKGISPGGIAGTAVGGVAVISASLLGALFLYRRSRAAGKPEPGSQEERIIQTPLTDFGVEPRRESDGYGSEL
ncbi:hypothetical protein LAWI1_G008903, partial [Lachnellula willkommii]